MASEDVSQACGSVITFSKPDTVKFVAKNYHQHFTSKLVSYRERERFTDVIVKCKHLELPCHKVVLAAASSYFNALFDGRVRKAEPEVVELTTFSPDILTIIIDFVYTAEISLSTDNVQSICTACDELQLEELKEGCDVFLSERVEPANCLGLNAFSKLHDIKLTMNKSKEYMMTKLPDILRLALDQQLKIINEDQLIEYISSDDLEVEDEAQVFEFVEKWVHADPRERESSVDRIMGHVRFGFCSTTHLCRVIKTSPIMESLKCKSLLLDAMAFQLDPEQTQSVASAKLKPRKHSEQLLLLDGCHNAQGKCWYMDNMKKEWKEFNTIPEVGCQWFRACVSGDDIIVTGGYISSKSKKASWAYSFSGKKWRMLPPMLNGRRIHAAISIGGEVYVIGGYSDTHGTISQVEKLDVKKQKWTVLAPMKLELDYHQAVKTDHELFVMAGRNKSGGASLTTQKYVISSDQWQLKADMPQPCMYGSAVYFKAQIYVVGSGTPCCMSYNPRQDAWTTHTQPVQGRNHSAAVVWEGKLLLCGGGRSDIEEYDVDTDKWTVWSKPLPATLQNPSMLTAAAQMS